MMCVLLLRNHKNNPSFRETSSHVDFRSFEGLKSDRIDRSSSASIVILLVVGGDRQRKSAPILLYLRT